MILLPALLLFYQFYYAVSSNSHLYYQQQTYNLIENIINWHNFNTNFWMVVSDGTTLSDQHVKSAYVTNTIPKIVYDLRAVNYPETRNFAAIFFADADQLSLARKLPPDTIKIYVDHNGCQLNETKLAESMNTLWLADEIGFIYYISFCNLSATSNYDSIDKAPPPHKDSNNCAINLFFHRPFVKNKSGQWGVLEKISLINDEEGRRWINMSSQVFHDFPFRRRHNMKLNRIYMTVILFPSTGAYLKSDMEIFRNEVSKEVLADPLHHLDAYFGEDVELLKELRERMDFTLTLSPTSDRQLYGFKVSVNT